MGFDFGECVICFILYGCNEGCEHPRNVCFGCLENVSDNVPEERLPLSYRLDRAIKESSFVSRFTCYLCKKEQNIGLELHVCENHFNFFE